MNKKLIATVVAASLVAPVVAHAKAEATIYGSIRAGLVSSDDDLENSDSELDLGATGSDGNIGGQGLWSRVGLRGSTDLGNGASAGFKMERGLSDDNLGRRDEYVWIEGGWGRLTIGNQDNPYRQATPWDQTWYLGGQYRFGDGGSRLEGIRYDYSNGPFSLALMATGNDNQADVALASTQVMGTTAGNVNEVTHTSTAEEKYADSVDSWVITAGYDFGPVTLNVAHRTDEKDVRVDPLVEGNAATAANIAIGNLETIQAADAAGRTSDTTAIGLNGSVGPVSWYLAYQSSDDNVDGPSGVENDVDSIGGFLGFAASERDTLYLYHASHDADRATYDGDDVSVGSDPTETVIGYSRSFGSGVTFIGEYLTIDKDLPAGIHGSDPDVLVLTLKVDF